MMAIEVRDLVKRYHGAGSNAVDGISFDVPRGQLFCLLGPNGAGKTTTISVLTTVMTPTSGHVRVAGRDLATEQSDIRGSIGIVFQQSSLDANLTAEENIRLHAVLYGLYPWRPLYRLMPPLTGSRYATWPRSSTSPLPSAAPCGRCPAAHAASWRSSVPCCISRRCCSSMSRPPGSTPHSRRSLWEYLRADPRRLGTTIVLTTHYLEEAETGPRSVRAVCR